MSVEELMPGRAVEQAACIALRACQAHVLIGAAHQRSNQALPVALAGALRGRALREHLPHCASSAATRCADAWRHCQHINRCKQCAVASRGRETAEHRGMPRLGSR
jgi:hypothetical protein